MSLPNVAVGEPILATTQNGLINHVNNSPGRAIFVSSGIWSVPAGVYKFRVYLCGGGGASAGVYGGGEDNPLVGVLEGGPSPLYSKDFAGVAIGTSFAITIGAGSTDANPGGTSSFGTVFSVSGGHAANPPNPGDRGVGNGEMIHSNRLFIYPGNTSQGEGQGYGTGGTAIGSGYTLLPLPAIGGICVIEW